MPAQDLLRQARLPIDHEYGTKFEQCHASEYATATKHALEEAYSRVQKKLDAAHHLQKTYYDQKVHGKPVVTGDFVWLFSPAVPRGHSKKLHHTLSGPYRVIAKLSETDYRVKKLTSWKMVRVVHFDRLKLWDPNTRFDDLLVTPSPTPPPHVSSGQDLFDMELLDSDDGDDTGPPSYPPQSVWNLYCTLNLRTNSLRWGVMYNWTDYYTCYCTVMHHHHTYTLIIIMNVSHMTDCLVL